MKSKTICNYSSLSCFLRALAAHSAQLLNIADLARGLGVAVNTAKAWFSVLEATCQVTVLRPYFANVGKRLIKTQKVYFTDIGTLCCYLAGLKIFGILKGHRDDFYQFLTQIKNNYLTES